jgi:hypothetical protein
MSPPVAHCARISAIFATAIALVMPLGACQLFAGIADNAQRSGSHEVKAKYAGLRGKTFAVLVAADRSVMGENADIVPLFTKEITRRLTDPTNDVGAAGCVPADEVLNFQYQRPGWVAMSPSDLAKQLEVQRLVFVELHSYELTEPGNPYVWAGSASGVVSVLEADSRLPDEFAFHESIGVKYPDAQGYSTLQMTREAVELPLQTRFVQRVVWLFIDHSEPNAIKY